ncbi:diguanylate cyclase [Salinisphaera sp. S4-8]|uniref:GGDEF domain-containing protein n=1 Tax=Salinisphaera sp. S4-8 TaxID=633357 RepID=UPI00333E2EEE
MGEALAALPDPVFVLTESGRYAAIFGGQDREYYHDGSFLVDFSLYDVLSQAQADWFLGEIRQTLADNCLRIVEYDLAAADVAGVDSNDGPATPIRFEGRVQPIRSPVNGERAVLWLASNITTRHEMEQRLRRLSETDELTGFPNRRRLMHALNEALTKYDTQNSRIALLIMDIDRFKTINDRYGHPAGDAVICAVSSACGARIKRRDLFARLGGEEFATVLYDITAAQALAVAERLRKTVADASFEPKPGEGPQVTVSIGVSVAGPNRRRSHDLLSQADAALYLAKTGGRNRVVLAEDCNY